MEKSASVNQFELRKKLQEAFRANRYLITITVLEDGRKTLNHFYSYENFPVDDVIPSLSHIAMEIDKL